MSTEEFREASHQNHQEFTGGNMQRSLGSDAYRDARVHNRTFQDLSKGLKRLENYFSNNSTGFTAGFWVRQPGGIIMVLDSASSWWVHTLTGSSLSGVETTTRELFIKRRSAIDKHYGKC